jgi:aminoglycoside phosphotransferase (APT) family kinase protein
MACGDRATDLASSWMVFDEVASRRAAREACGGVSDATWARARGWAVYFATVFSERRFCEAFARDPD